MITYITIFASIIGIISIATWEIGKIKKGILILILLLASFGFGYYYPKINSELRSSELTEIEKINAIEHLMENRVSNKKFVKLVNYSQEVTVYPEIKKGRLKIMVMTPDESKYIKDEISVDRLYDVLLNGKSIQVQSEWENFTLSYSDDSFVLKIKQ